jgi:hypothetical protein
MLRALFDLREEADATAQAIEVAAPALDDVWVREQELGKQSAVLTDHAGDQSNTLNHIMPYPNNIKNKFDFND